MIFNYCGKCATKLRLTEEFEIRGMIIVGVCPSCGWRSPIIEDHRIQPKPFHIPTVTEDHEVLIFTGDNLTILRELREYSEKDQTLLVDDVASLINYYLSQGK